MPKPNYFDAPEQKSNPVVTVCSLEHLEYYEALPRYSAPPQGELARNVAYWITDRFKADTPTTLVSMVSQQPLVDSSDEEAEQKSPDVDRLKLFIFSDEVKNLTLKADTFQLSDLLEKKAPNFDVFGIHSLYAQMHHIAAAHPKAQIIFHSVQDYLCLPLTLFFTQHSHLIPNNVELHLWHNPQAKHDDIAFGDCTEKAVIQGRGAPLTEEDLEAKMKTLATAALHEDPPHLLAKIWTLMIGVDSKLESHERLYGYTRLHQIIGWRASRGNIANSVYAVLNVLLFLPRFLALGLINLLYGGLHLGGAYLFGEWPYGKKRIEEITFLHSPLKFIFLRVHALLYAILSLSLFAAQAVFYPRAPFSQNTKIALSEFGYFPILIGLFLFQLPPWGFKYLYTPLKVLTSLTAYATAAFFLSTYIFAASPPAFLIWLGHSVVSPALFLIAKVHVSETLLFSITAAALTVVAAVVVMGFLEAMDRYSVPNDPPKGLAAGNIPLRGGPAHPTAPTDQLARLEYGDEDTFSMHGSGSESGRTNMRHSSGAEWW